LIAPAKRLTNRAARELFSPIFPAPKRETSIWKCMPSRRAACGQFVRVAHPFLSGPITAKNFAVL
jgi:hypothetical protein